jgi:hypothetical protein
MSKSFLYRTKELFNYFLCEPPQLSYSMNGLKLNLFISGIFLGFHGYYAVSTKENKDICIVKKYLFVRNGFTEFMIIDKEGNHYNVNNSLWYWKWNSIEDWHNIETDKEINAKYYGWRVPIIGLFPNIVQLENTNQSNKCEQTTFSKNNNQSTENYYYL